EAGFRSEGTYRCAWGAVLRRGRRHPRGTMEERWLCRRHGDGQRGWIFRRSDRDAIHQWHTVLHNRHAGYLRLSGRLQPVEERWYHGWHGAAQGWCWSYSVGDVADQPERCAVLPSK